jgi:hypothetical protein
MAKKKPFQGPVNDELLNYLSRRAWLPAGGCARSVSKFRDAESGEREARERKRAGRRAAATRAYYERNADKVRAAKRAWQRDASGVARRATPSDADDADAAAGTEGVAVA